MGLPHVLVRFYTNPDGRAARRTTLIVLALLGVFYLLPTVYGALGRVYASDLVASGRADTVVLALPERVIGGAGRRPARRAAGGRRVRGVPVHVVRARGVGRGRAEPGRAEPGARARAAALGGVAAFRLAALVAMSVPLLLAFAHRTARGGVVGGAGVRGRGLDVLPAAGARHLVARADRRRCAGRAARRRPGLGGSPSCSPSPTRPGRVGGRAARPAGRVDRAGGVRRDDRRSRSRRRRGSRRASPGRWSGCTPPRASTSTAAPGSPGTDLPPLGLTSTARPRDVR